MRRNCQFFYFHDFLNKFKERNDIYQLDFTYNNKKEDYKIQLCKRPKKNIIDFSLIESFHFDGFHIDNIKFSFIDIPNIDSQFTFWVNKELRNKDSLKIKIKELKIHTLCPLTKEILETINLYGVSISSIQINNKYDILVRGIFELKIDNFTIS